MRDTQAKRAFFAVLRHGALSEAEAGLWPAALRADLIREGIVKRREDGGLELVNAGAYSSTGSSPPPAETVPPPAPVEQTVTLTGRVTPADLEWIDSLGYATRSEAVRAIVAKARAAGSGLRPATRKVG